jgi:hypothetical protein
VSLKSYYYYILLDSRRYNTTTILLGQTPWQQQRISAPDATGEGNCNNIHKNGFGREGGCGTVVGGNICGVVVGRCDDGYNGNKVCIAPG